MTPPAMRAARVHRFGAPPLLESVPLPAGDGVLVEVCAASVTHLDLTVASGDFARRPALPYVPGTQGVGVVREGPRAGERVRIRGAGIGVDRDGCWAEWVRVPADALASAPADLDAATAVALPTAATTAYVAVHDVARVTRDDTVVVTGAGGAVGRLATQLVVRAGARRVLGVVSGADRVDGVPEGAEPVPGVDALAAAVGPGGATAVVDTVGGPVLEALLAGAVAPGGRVAVVGYTAGTALSLDLPRWLLGEVALLPVNMLHRGERSRDLQPGLDRLAAAGVLHLPVERVTWSGLGGALARMGRGEVRGRLVLCPGHEA